jgi:hypothetical protein
MSAIRKITVSLLLTKLVVEASRERDNYHETTDRNTQRAAVSRVADLVDIATEEILEMMDAQS